ncbi:hypothetical protein [Flavobacterium caseinilyticum]|uniref:Uncharacterized protein n=1 Tax=Flavobacterium caseinilyticum TaxID=2541732 RepID=A0A4V2YUB5_9FLAO|nr:hypothetical protein [Flavobacterium caseinilyticum]TDD77047.1 hypothetical protein E0F89_05465 [Flavobacterium caseinilyticum]
MKKLHYTLFLFFLVFKISSQNVQVDIITNQNDTIKEFRLKKDYLLENLMVLDLEKKLFVVNGKGEKKEFFPNEVKSFSFTRENKRFEFIAIDDNVFGLLLYSNKLKLLKVIKPGYTTVNFYVIVRPNNGKKSFMEAMGLGRLISKKVISREITDCPSVLEKVENKILKISGEEGVIELIKEYESSCF